MMRETIKDWKDEWIETNGLTHDFEVVIKLDSDTTVYEGSFVDIPPELEEERVNSYAKILTSSVPARIGAYSLTIMI